jgi:aspartate racemase
MKDIHQRIASLTPEKRALLEERLASSSTVMSRPKPIQHVATGVQVPSFGQEILWAMEQIEGGTAQYNVCFSIRLRGKVEVAAIKKALSALVNRHETLRTRYMMGTDGRLHLGLSALEEFPLSLTDLSGVEESTRENTLSAAMRSEANQPLVLDRDRVIRAVLYRLDDSLSVLQLTIHHAAIDGWSMGVFFREFAVYYNAEAKGTTAGLPELPIAFSDYARWQREQMSGPEGERLISYWKEQVRGSSFKLRLPTDRPRPAKRTFCGAVRRYMVPAALASAMHEYCLRANVTPFMLALAAVYAVLARYSGQSDILIGSPIAARSRVETEGLVGFFTNTVLLRGNLDVDPTFSELLQQVKRTTLEAYTNQDMPLELLIDKIVPERDASSSALFQVVLTFQNSPVHKLELQGLETSVQEVKNDTAKFELLIELTPSGEALNARIEYNTDLFDSGTIDRLWGHLTSYLHQAIVAPERKAAAIGLLTAAERNQLLVEWNDTKRAYPRKTSLASLVEAQAERTPDAIAVTYDETQLTYRELNAHANQLAHRLLRLGAKPREKIGIAIERSPEMIAGILAILKAGAAYVPIDLAYSLERRDFMMRDCSIRFLLTTQPDTPLITGCEVELIDARFNADHQDERDGENPPSRAGLDSPAYVMYTSGSTGRPKGVEISQRGIVRLVVGSEFAELNEKQVFLQLAPASFDASTFEIWGALLHGAKLVLFAGSSLDVDKLGATLSSYKVTTLWLTSSLFNAIIDTAPDSLAPVRQLLVGGEALSVPHVIRAIKALPNTKLINGYGPTECTTFACCYPIPQDIDPACTSIPIGRPIANTQVYNLDRNLQPLPVGVVGNLYIGGDGLALGYLNLSELTKDSFISNPFLPNERIYKTGDLVRYMPDGNLEFVGRADDQVKIRGYRIELGEIEKALKEQLEIAQAVVEAREDQAGDKRLVAYLVAWAGVALSSSDVRRRLKQTLPDYMVPTSYVFLDRLPISRNGKIDRKALPAPEKTGIALANESGAPRDSLEETLAKIWAEVLGVKDLGIRDNFFEMGGHSVLAVQLFARILAVIPECQPSLALLVKAPTVELFARTLRGGRAEWSYVVPMREGTERPPFFCVHGAGGHVLIMRDLAMAMPPDQPFYCLQSRGLDGHSAPFSTIEEAAECYVEEIRKIQFHGPYFLGGRSSGGAVAYEMARRLQSMGETVGVVALFDTLNFAYPRLISKPKLFYFNFCLFLYRVRHHLKILDHMKLRDWSGYLAGRARIIPHWLRKHAQKGRRRNRGSSTNDVQPSKSNQRDGNLDWMEALNVVLEANTSAAKEFIPKPYSGDVLVFKAKGQEGYLYQDKALGWGPVALGGITTHEIDGDHHSILRSPNVNAIAQKLDNAIRAAQRVAEDGVQHTEEDLVSLET